MPTPTTIRFALNGTDTNPWHRLGLKCDPFPQIAQAEYDAGCRALNKLGGDPIPRDRPEAYIRDVLAGFDPAFIDRVVAAYRPGEIVGLAFTFDLDSERYGAPASA